MSQVDDVQAELKKVDGEGDKLPLQQFSFYLKSEVSFEIISKKWGTFTALAGIVYLYHLLWTINGVDKYADNTRMLLCDGITYTGTLDEQQADASSVFDGAILAVTIFHMIEWVRWTAYLTMALVSVNLMPFFYLLSLNIIYGFFALVFAAITSMSEDGTACGDSHQPERQRYLMLQIVVLVLWLPICFAHPLFLRFKGTQWCHSIYLMEDDGEEED